MDRDGQSLPEEYTFHETVDKWSSKEDQWCKAVHDPESDEESQIFQMDKQ